MSTIHLTCIVNGHAYERDIDSQRAQMSGEILIVGSPDTTADILARLFHEASQMRDEIYRDHPPTTR